MAGWMAEHRKARMVCPQGPCEACGAANAEVHHKNEDWTDHRPENLQRLCRSCHMKAHRSGARCILCERPHKGLGYCEMHYQRLKRHGDPEHKRIRPACSVEGCESPNHSMGYCSKHAQQCKRGTLGKPQMTKSEAASARWRSEG